MSEEEIKVKLEEMIEFYTLNTDLGVVTQTERTKMLEEILNLINKQEGYISKDKIREIINKYVDIEEQLNYSSNELFGEELTNMINELLEE